MNTINNQTFSASSQPPMIPLNLLQDLSNQKEPIRQTAY